METSTKARVKVCILPRGHTAYEDAARSAGAALVDAVATPDALVWAYVGKAEQLARRLPAMHSLRWVQLPSAGVEDYFNSGVVQSRDDVVWTSAKGAYAEPVAEHALALILALLRQLPARLRTDRWGAQAGRLCTAERC
jgi:phosphoglycerate dehydrogenase-like enzyme